MRGDSEMEPAPRGKRPAQLPRDPTYEEELAQVELAVLRDPENLPKKPPTVVTALHLSPWPGVEELWMEGSPYDLPIVDGERVVIIEDSDHAHVVPVEPSFPALRPTVTIAGELAKPAVSKLLAAMKTAAAKAKSKAKPKSKSKSKTAKRPSKKKS